MLINNNIILDRIRYGQQNPRTRRRHQLTPKVLSRCRTHQRPKLPRTTNLQTQNRTRQTPFRQSHRISPQTHPRLQTRIKKIDRQSLLYSTNQIRLGPRRQQSQVSIDLSRIIFSLDGVGKQCTKEQVDVTFDKWSVEMKLRGYNNQNLIFAIKKLFAEINPA